MSMQICSKNPKTTSCICQATCDVEIVRSQAPLNVEHLAVPPEKTCDAIKVIDSKCINHFCLQYIYYNFIHNFACLNTSTRTFRSTCCACVASLV